MKRIANWIQQSEAALHRAAKLMSPLMQRMLESKDARRKRLMALPWPEKVRIVEQMRAAAREIHSAEENALILREEPPPYGGKKKP